MVIFVAFFQSAKNGNRACLIGLFYQHNLETPFECFIFLKIFLVLVQRSCTDGTQFTTRQCRFQNIGSIHSTFTAAGSYQRVNFVNKQNDFAFGFNHFIYNGFKTFLKFALVFGTCHQRPHIQTKNLFGFQIFGYIAAHNTMRQTLSYGSFSHARLTNQNRIVFGTTAQNLQHATYFFVTPDNRIEFAAASAFVQVDSVFFERLVSCFRTLAFYLASLAQIGNSSTQTINIHARILKRFLHGIALIDQRQ
ncbi:MAG: hypothetical protein BWX65_00227 [Bacteroidetes bacterium ADurb.Bin057]|nr:MAG: hypothetical protein BWX65_00227 [Bacteroidetes bacterium ADurb.Bin057]